MQFLKLPVELITDKNITSNEFRIFTYLLSLYNEEKGYSFPSMRTISDNLNISLATVQKSIKQLVKLGYMIIEQIKSNSNNTMNVYKKLKHLILDKKEKEVPAEEPKEVEGQINIDEVPTVKKVKYNSSWKKQKKTKFTDYEGQKKYDESYYDDLIGF